MFLFMLKRVLTTCTSTVFGSVSINGYERKKLIITCNNANKSEINGLHNAGVYTVI